VEFPDARLHFANGANPGGSASRSTSRTPISRSRISICCGMTRRPTKAGSIPPPSTG
jgi:hypothetical protein